MRAATQPGITPPAPGQDKEEPELWPEEDIPKDDRGSASDEEPAQRHPDRNERDD